jgi:threonine dehydrogenase-like Zn-dependent dehydrogenase
MQAVAFHGKRDVRVDTVPDPTIEEPTDAIVRITSSGICGSDLHLYEVMGAFMDEGDILGHEPMGIVEAVGSAVEQVAPGDRVVIPFNVSCGSCYMCDQHLYSQCETTQVREQRKGASLLGYTPREAPRPCSGSVRLVRCRPGSLSSRGPPRSSASTWCRSDWRWPVATVSIPSTSATASRHRTDCGS